jgi:hypothetical protein
MCATHPADYLTRLLVRFLLVVGRASTRFSKNARAMRLYPCSVIVVPFCCCGFPHSYKRNTLVETCQVFLL